ncbi:MAG: pilus assembly protein N-terminal domain-containing protein [Alphaproteobacteria bacterium]|nr:pilus assembly protein N-terminal domain-containing protein [Alphaproteobacteria bacterium]
MFFVVSALAGEVVMGPGAAVLLDVPKAVHTVTVVDPGVAKVVQAGGAFRVEARGPGRTDVLFADETGRVRVETIRVTADGGSPQTSGWLDLPVGGTVALEGSPEAVVIVDPGVVRAVQVGGTVLQAVGPGTTDVLVQEKGTWTIRSVHAGTGGRTTSGLRSPKREAVALEVGAAHILDVSPEQVSIVDPGVVGARQLGRSLVLEARGPGYTDVVLQDGRSLRVLAVTVGPR